MMYGKEAEFETAKQNISAVPLPKNGPVFGANGQLVEYWKQK